jgi:dihydrolipoamide dehydrogenase
MLPRLVPAEDDEIAQALEREMKKQKIAIHLDTKVEGMKDGADGALDARRCRRQDRHGGHRAGRDRPAPVHRRPRPRGARRRARRPRQDRGERPAPDLGAGSLRDRRRHRHQAARALRLRAGQGGGRGDRRASGADQLARGAGRHLHHPEIASVGLTEREARAEGREVKIGRFPFRAHGRNIADGETTGFVKLLADAGTDQVLGAHIIGAKASELIHECALAIAADLNAGDLAQAIHAHPTFTEAIGEAAEDVEGVRSI